MKHQNLDNRERLCCNCCNGFPIDYPNCPFCLHEGGMLIGEDNRIALQGRHLIIRLPLGMINWEAISKIFKKKIIPRGGASLKHPISFTTYLRKEKTNEKEKHTKKFRKAVKRLPRFITFIFKNK